VICQAHFYICTKISHLFRIVFSLVNIFEGIMC